MTMTVNLGAPLEAFVEEAVGTGRYGSRSEVLREGVRLVQEREINFAHLDAMVLADRDRLLAQPSYALEDVAEELRSRLKAKLDGNAA